MKIRRIGACLLAMLAGTQARATPTNSSPQEPTVVARPDAAGIYAESLSRLPPPRREEMDAEEQRLFDRLLDLNTSAARKTSGPGLGLRGPSGVYLHSPRLAEATTRLNEYLRFQAGLPDSLREIAILVVARETGSGYEWAAHEPVARRAGVPEPAIAAIRDRSSLTGLNESDAAVIALLREALSAPSVSRETYDAAVARLGARRLIDVTALASQYLGTAMMLKVFALHMPDGTEPRTPW